MKRRRRHATPAPRHAAGAVKNEINVTPLVDVVLVLLIIFMVVTPMLGRGVKIELPEIHKPEKKPDTGEQIIVSVAQDKKVYIDTDEVVEGRLIETVKEALQKKKPDGTNRDLHVKGDRRLTYGEVRKVLELLHEAGAESIALGAEEPKAAGAAAGKE